MSRKKGRPAFKNKSKIQSVYLTARTQQALRSRSKTTGFSVSDLFEYCWYVAGPGANKASLERFRTSAPEQPEDTGAAA